MSGINSSVPDFSIGENPQLDISYAELQTNSKRAAHSQQPLKDLAERIFSDTSSASRQGKLQKTGSTTEKISDPALLNAINDERLYLEKVIHQVKSLASQYLAPSLSDIRLPENKLSTYLATVQAEKSSHLGVVLYSFRAADGLSYQMIQKSSSKREIFNEIKANVTFKSLNTTYIQFPDLLSVMPSINIFSMQLSLVMSKQPGLTLNEWWMKAVNDPSALDDAILATYTTGQGLGELHSKRVSQAPLSTEVIEGLCEELRTYYKAATEDATKFNLSIPNDSAEIETAISNFKSSRPFGGLCHGDGHSGNILYDKTEGLSFVDLDQIAKSIDCQGNSITHFTQRFLYTYDSLINNIEILNISKHAKDRLIQAFHEGHNSTFTLVDQESSADFSRLYIHYKGIYTRKPTGSDLEIALQNNFTLLSKRPCLGKLFP